MSILSSIELNSEIESLKIELKKANKELRWAPNGTLGIEHRKNNWRFFLIEGQGESRTRKGITADKNQVEILARKIYLEQKVKILSTDIELLERISKQYLAPNNTEIINKVLASKHLGSTKDTKNAKNNLGQALPGELDMSMFFKPLTPIAAIAPSKTQSNAEADLFSNSKYEMSTYHPEGKRFPIGDVNFTKVRSKSELIIAQKLMEHNIRFHYEEILRLNDGTSYVPDFTIRKYDGKIIYWEHFGMMSNEEYKAEHHKKIKAYADNGIGPWDNLITTYDSLEGIVNILEIESIINYRLLL